MMLLKEAKQQLQKKFGRHEKDTGSCEYQISVLNRRIKDLNEHLKEHKKDYACKRGLMLLIGRIKRLQRYFSKKNPAEYQKLIKALDIRR